MCLLLLSAAFPQKWCRGGGAARYLRTAPARRRDVLHVRDVGVRCIGWRACLQSRPGQDAAVGECV